MEINVKSFAARRLSLATAVLMAVASASASGPAAAQVAGEEHMSADGEAKCRAFRKVVQDTRELQQAHHGALPAAVRARLDHQLSAARHMPPHSLSALKCGTAL